MCEEREREADLGVGVGDEGLVVGVEADGDGEDVGHVAPAQLVGLQRVLEVAQPNARQHLVCREGRRVVVLQPIPKHTTTFNHVTFPTPC